MKILVTGITGQDGSYLADMFVAEGHEVHGVARRTSTGNRKNIAHLAGKVTLWDGDVTDTARLQDIIWTVSPHQIYHMADQDHVAWSYDNPGHSFAITVGSVITVLEAARKIPGIRVLIPCSATMFGTELPRQDENTPLGPLSPYAVAKCAAWHAIDYYRNVHHLFVSTAILFNHDSPRRTEEYLPHKLAAAAVRIASGKQQHIEVGNLDTLLDVGYSPEYCRAMSLILNHNSPDDFVVGSGEACTIEDLATVALQHAGINNTSGRIRINHSFNRPGPRSTLIADPTKIQEVLGWEAEIHGTGLVRQLVDHYKGVA